MKRTAYLKRVMAGALAGAVGLSACFAPLSAQAAEKARTKQIKQAEQSKGEILLNPQLHYQTLRGWGTSLCWWGNSIGSWGNEDFNGDGRPDREEIAELAFSPDYLNLNIVRYNVGGGDKEDTSIKRCEGLVPGWTEDMTGTKDGTGDFNEKEFYAKKTEEMADAGQLWMLEQANEYRRDQKDIINEVFSNSPPYYMTNSGSSTGGENASENLKADQVDNFTAYLARAARWINQDLQTKYNTSVDYIEPLNEPDTTYWGNGSTKQEGCVVKPGENQSKVYESMAKALDAEGLNDIQITGTDETALWNAINSFKQLSDASKQNITTIGAHTYSGSNEERKELRRLAASYGKDLWMSEVTKGGSGHSHDTMGAANAKDQSEGIMNDLKLMQPTAWIAWLVADSEYECLQTNESWGLLHTVFEENGPVPDYHRNLVNPDGSKKDGVPDKGYWAVTKQFYTMMQYSKYLKAGYTMVDIGDDNMCAAISPDGKELVIVAQNFNSKRNTTVDLSGLEGTLSAKIFQTSDSRNCEELEKQDVSDHVLDVKLPANSVTTYVVTEADNKKMCDPTKDYMKIVDADVAKAADWVESTDRFEYTGEWKESGDGYEGKYSNGGSATLKFNGNQAVFYGTKDAGCGDVTITVDNQEPKTVSLSAAEKRQNVYLFHTDKLADGGHTVTIANAEGSENKLIELESARIITGNPKSEVVEVKKPECVYTVSGVEPVLPDTVTVVTDQGTEGEERNVTWNLDGVRFEKDLTLEGSVEGSREKTEIDVKVVPENMVYVIDCNNPESPWYKNVNAYAELLNKTADKQYTADSWGYLEEYGKPDGPHDSEDKYDMGWYAESGQSIQYTLPLEAGTYHIHFGFKEWWNQNRPMKVIKQEGEGEGDRVELGETDSWNDAEYDVTVNQTGNVTFIIEKRDDSAPDPVLSFIEVQNKLDLSELKKQLKRAASIERSEYKEAELSEVDAAVKEAQPLLYKASATQAKVNGAAEKVKAALDALTGADWSKLTATEIKKNDYVLYTVNCGTSDNTVLPNPDTYRWGLLQSVMDQENGTDEARGFTWGRDADTDHSKMVSRDVNAADVGDSFVYMDDNAAFDPEKSQLGYSFQVPDYKINGIEENTYEVKVAFKLPDWDPRQVNICLENGTVATDVYLDRNTWVEDTYTVKVTDGELNVAVKAPRRVDTKGDPILNFIEIRAVEEKQTAAPAYDSFTGADGEPMYDNNGVQIQAHGGQIQQFTVDGRTKWYWIGEDKTNDYRPVGGIHMYSSDDLYNWTDEGIILETMESMADFEKEPFKSLYGDLTQEEKEEIFVDLDKNNTVMERPKILYNKKNDNYVIWFHCDGRTKGSDADYGKAKAGIAVGKSPTGPFTFKGSYKLYNNGDEANGRHGYDGWENRGSVRDMNLFKDDDGTAYVIYSSEGNETTFIAKLNEDYTWLATGKPGDRDHGTIGTDFTRNFEGWSREAPAMFKYKGKYYIVNSGCSGWSPNQAQYFVADHPMGPYTSKGDPCPDWGSGTTYDTQSTCVIPVNPDEGQFIYMGDRWFANDLSDSRYVWLPIEFKGNDEIAIRRYSDWRLGGLDDQGSFTIETKLPVSVESAAEIKTVLPKEIEISYGKDTEKETTPVRWTIPSVSEGRLGTVSVTGTMFKKNKSFTHQIHIVDPKTRYFFDCAASQNAVNQTSEYFEALKEKIGSKLGNTVADQAYSEETKAGYTGTVEETGQNFDLGIHTGTTILEKGWWAGSGKNIEYAFELKKGTYRVAAGFQEWWDTQREMKLTVSTAEKGTLAEKAVLAEKDFVLWSDSKDRQIDQEFELTEDSIVKVSVSKTGDADPVLSWISMMGEDQQTAEADKTGLTAKITEAKAISGDGYTAESYQALLTAIREAEAIVADADATEEEVKNAVTALETAIKGLTEEEKPEPVDKTGLTAKITEAKAISGDGYTAESYQALLTAIEKAEAIVADADATEEEVKNAVTALETAIKGLTEEEKPEPADKTGLTAKITEAKAIGGDGYTAESYQALLTAIKEAEAIVSDADATQDDVDKVLAALDAAVKGLVTRQVVSIRITKQPSQTEYLMGEPLKESEIEIEAVYNDETTEIITEGFEVSGYDADNPGLQTVTVTYEGKTAAFEVTVKGAVILKDDKTGVSVSIETGQNVEDITLGAEQKELGEAQISEMLETIAGMLEETSEGIVLSEENAAVFEIRLADGSGEEVTPEKEVMVTIPKPEGYSNNLKLFHNHKNVLEEIPFTLSENGGLVFRISDFGLFTIIDPGEPVKPDVTELEKALADAEALNPSDYTEETWKVLEDRIREAKELLKNAGAVQDGINAKTEEIRAAIGQLKKKEVVDKTELGSALEEAKKLKKEDYTEEAWKIFQEKLKEAEAVLANENATKEQTDAVIAELKTAMDHLKQNPSVPDEKPSAGKPSTEKTGPVKVKTIRVSGISRKIAAGAKIKLTASVSPSNAADKNVIWKSGNKKVATVNSKGVVTMKKKSGGKSVVITAIAKDGSGVKAAYRITSMKGKVKKVSISGKKSVKAGKSLKLKATVKAGKKANRTLKWVSSNRKYAAVSKSGKVKTYKAGKGKKVKITAMATDGSGKKKTITIILKK